MLAAGSLFVSLLEIFLLVISGRGAKVEVLVAERTAELNRVNAVMKEEIAVRETAEAALRESEQRLLANAGAPAPAAIGTRRSDPPRGLSRRGSGENVATRRRDGFPDDGGRARESGDSTRIEQPSTAWISTSAR